MERTRSGARVAALWYFGYGSNMCRSTFLGRRRMRPLAVRWGWLDDFRLCFDLPVGPGERGVANVRQRRGHRVCGVLYLLTPADCTHLDRTEGVHRGYYRRIGVRVLAEGEEWLDAFTYHSARGRPDRKPSARYMELLLRGAREHGLPAEYVGYLRGFELARDERTSDPTQLRLPG